MILIHLNVFQTTLEMYFVHILTKHGQVNMNKVNRKYLSVTSLKLVTSLFSVTLQTFLTTSTECGMTQNFSNYESYH